MDAFEAHRPHLHAVATRILGSRAEADDALQEAWLRLDRADTSDVDNIGGWLTTVVSRVCLTMLDARKRRREEALEAGRLPDPVITRADEAAPDPEGEALAADAVGAALLVVLETLQPAERLSFVLHDLFGVPFEDIAPIVERSPAAARQLASRARRRVRGADRDAPTADRQIVDAFLAAARGGDFAALLELLDPDVVLRTDDGGGALHLGGNLEDALVAHANRWPGDADRPDAIAGVIEDRRSDAVRGEHGLVAVVEVMARDSAELFNRRRSGLEPGHAVYEHVAAVARQQEGPRVQRRGERQRRGRRGV